jgi:hypothetical protein
MTGEKGGYDLVSILLEYRISGELQPGDLEIRGYYYPSGQNFSKKKT